MANTAVKKARQGLVEYSVEDVKGQDYSHIFRSERDEKEAIALYDSKTGIVELLPGKESYKTACITHLNNTGRKFKEVCKIGTDLQEKADGEPPVPKQSRQEGEKTPKLVEHYARWRPEVFWSKYGCQQLQERVRIETHMREVRDDRDKIVKEPYEIPIYEDVDNRDYDINRLKDGSQRIIARMKTILTVRVKDDEHSDQYDDALDAAINDAREDQLS